MPRLTPALLNHASRTSPHLPLLLRECRDLDSAKNELRWLREHIAETHHLSPSTLAAILPGAKSAAYRRKRCDGTLLSTLVKRRARGEPLQYILGSQPFGELDILCRPNVLIPRPETETYTTEVARLCRQVLLAHPARALTIADFCSGSGCISLLLHSILNAPSPSDGVWVSLQIRGFDISEHALVLARANLQHNLQLNTLHERAADQIRFQELDLLALACLPQETILDHLRLDKSQHTAVDQLDIIISNPPYIAPEDYNPGGRTTKSVRKYEPELALVPPSCLTFQQVNRADQFYAALLHVSSATRPKLLVMEVGDTNQALRVRGLCRQHLRGASKLTTGDPHPPVIEIWRDDGSIVHDEYESACETSPLMENGHASDAGHNVSVDVDPDVDCRAVVIWLDPAWIRFRQRYTRSS